jgi:hypothetical protein
MREFATNAAIKPAATAPQRSAATILADHSLGGYGQSRRYS